MSISAEWTDESQTIFLVTYHPGWTLQEFQRVMQHSRDVSKDLDHPFYAINDISAAPKAPKGQALSILREVAQKSPPMIRFVYIVGPDMFISNLVSVIGKLIPATAKMWRVVPNVETAYALIEADKQALLAERSTSRER
jgi:hypothetical protein